jgi:hypothetical protein
VTGYDEKDKGRPRPYILVQKSVGV